MIPQRHLLSFSHTFALSLSLIRLQIFFFFCSVSFSWHKAMSIFSKRPGECEDEFEGKENKVVSYIDESNRDRETEDMMMMVINNNNNNNQHNNGVEFDFEIWPVEHPMEPPDEDRPVKCPIPHSSVINEEGKREKRVAESLRKRAEEHKKVGKKEGEEEEQEREEEEEAAVMERPVRAVRKRHHMTLTGENDYSDSSTIMPLSRMPPLPPLPTQNLTIFQMLQQFGKFES